ncbi:hypothetical protein WISP_136295 [Willisornis vidua]|uniref:Rna-directed dna polymerase from mobile element jockey-like n=1 Tax=Willisornis vidua TaxID=1566151 RepID=A0ABQ9CU11_9PASS|nr:hypothetical protein WISP_136295 [Willisornis vidua]
METLHLTDTCQDIKNIASNGKKLIALNNESWSAKAEENSITKDRVALGCLTQLHDAGGYDTELVKDVQSSGIADATQAKGQLLQELSKGTQDLMVISSVKVSLIKLEKMHIIIWVLSNTELKRNRQIVCMIWGIPILCLPDWTQHTQDNQGIGPSQQEFVKGRSCLTNLIFYDKMTCLVAEGKSVGVIYLDFSKALDTISHSILLEKLAAHDLNGCTV